MAAARNINRVMEKFKEDSGLTVNNTKSSIIFSGCNESLKAEICDTLQFSQQSLPVKYLGLPLFSANMKLQYC